MFLFNAEIWYISVYLLKAIIIYFPKIILTQQLGFMYSHAKLIMYFQLDGIKYFLLNINNHFCKLLYSIKYFYQSKKKFSDVYMVQIWLYHPHNLKQIIYNHTLGPNSYCYSICELAWD